MLKKVVVILQNVISPEEQEQFQNMLAREKVECVWYYAGEPMEEVPDIFAEEKKEKQDILFISSVPEICRLAVQGKCSCIAYLGNHTEGESFAGIKYAIESFDGIDITYLERICRRYAGKPWEILQTKRCIVRETTVEDVDAFYKIYAEPSITAHMEGLFEDREKEIAYVKNYIKNIYHFYEYGLWTVLEKESGNVIGRAGISWREETQTVEIGYVIAVPYQQKGYAYEVCDAISNYAKEELELEELYAYIKEENEASIRLCKKLGFQKGEMVPIRNKFYRCFKRVLD